MNNLQDNQKHFNWKQLSNLNYMERVIKESMRLYPSVTSLTRYVTKEIKSKSGYTIPKGCELFINIYDIHRDEKHWPDPEKFDPDRFLPDNCVNRHPFAYMPFSAGPRNCLGKGKIFRNKL